MSIDIVETKMFTIFQLVNDWLKFAEAKNLAVIALSGATCSALATYLTSAQSLTPDWRAILLVSVFFFALSCMTSLLSFVPQTSLEYILALIPRRSEPSSEDNLYFYKHLGKYKPEFLAKKYQDLFSSSKNTPSSAHKQLAAQIIVNSRITANKLHFFTIALLLTLFAIGTILIPLIYNSLKLFSAL